ncbi:MAG: hypothetical protein ACLTBV_19060 [Enterocloster bolteae]
MMEFPEEKLLLFQTPATAIGSSRYALEQEDYDAMVGIFRKYGLRMSSSMETAPWIPADAFMRRCKGEEIWRGGDSQDH